MSQNINRNHYNLYKILQWHLHCMLLTMTLTQPLAKNTKNKISKIIIREKAETHSGSDKWSPRLHSFRNGYTDSMFGQT